MTVKKLLNKKMQLIGAFFVLILLASSVTGCKSGSTATAALTVINGTQTKTFTVAQLEALPSITGSTGDITSSGTIEGPYQYQGVALTDILKTVGGITSDEAVRISAKDGYSMTMSYKQVTKGPNFLPMTVPLEKK